jgi:hypothetical protein
MASVEAEDVAVTYELASVQILERDLRQTNQNLTATQTRCSVLLEENRAMRMAAQSLCESVGWAKAVAKALADLRGSVAVPVSSQPAVGALGFEADGLGTKAALRAEVMREAAAIVGTRAETWSLRVGRWPYAEIVLEALLLVRDRLILHAYAPDIAAQQTEAP